MSNQDILPSRKSDHIRINLEEDVRSALTTGLERYHFVHQALPELNYAEIDLSQPLFGKTLRAPLLISSMTGGTAQAAEINRRLALAAQHSGVAMGLGRCGGHRKTRTGRDLSGSPYATDILLFANWARFN